MIEADVDTWDFGTKRWDLVAFIYTGGLDTATVAKVEPAIKKGGLLVVEYAPRPGGGGKAADPPLASLFAKDRWRLVRDEEVEDQPDFGKTRTMVRRLVAERL
jgi:hypothetical protein